MSEPPAAVVAREIDSPRAWRVAVAASVVVGVAFGTIYSFGAFFDAMAEEFDAGLGATSVTFGVTVFLFFGTGAGSGFLSDRWGARPLVWAGGALFVAGLVATSQVDDLWQGYVTYGIGVGLGGGLFLAPLFAVAAAWFDTYRAVAQGVVATGSGLGTLVLVPLAERLIGASGWRHAYVVLAVVAAVVFAVGGALVDRPPVSGPPSATGHLRAVLRSAEFRRFGLSGTMQSASLISAFAFIVPFATDDGVSSSAAAWVVAVVGAASIAGRLALTGVSSRFGPVRMLQLCFLVQPVAFTLWLVAGGNIVLLMIFAVLLGVAYGGYVAHIGLVTAHLFGIQGIGSVMGWVYLTGGVGSLLYPPVVGAIADATTSNTVPILAVVAASALGSVILLGLRTEPMAS